MSTFSVDHGTAGALSRPVRSHTPHSRADFEPFAARLEVVPWEDPDRRGHDPRGEYVERFWLGLLGPSTTLLVRRLSRGLEGCPSGVRVDLAETGLALGLGDSVSRNSSLQRSLLRACQFGIAQRVSDQRIALRTEIPSLSRRQLERLPDSVRKAHDQWKVEATSHDLIARVRVAAFGLAASGEPLGVIERQLLRWGIDPVVARDAALDAYSGER